MGTYEELKAAIQQVIRTNGNNEITGALLQNALLSIVNVVGANATFAGIATPNTNPGTADQNVFYLATEAGTYVNFGGIVINTGEAVILSNKTGNWVKTTSGFATQQQLTELESKTNTYSFVNIAEGNINAFKKLISEIYVVGSDISQNFKITYIGFNYSSFGGSGGLGLQVAYIKEGEYENSFNPTNYSATAFEWLPNTIYELNAYGQGLAKDGIRVFVRTSPNFVWRTISELWHSEELIRINASGKGVNLIPFVTPIEQEISETKKESSQEARLLSIINNGFDIEANEVGYLDESGQKVIVAGYNVTEFIPVIPNLVYQYKGGYVPGTLKAVWGYEDDKGNGATPIVEFGVGEMQRNFVVADNIKYIRAFSADGRGKATISKVIKREIIVGEDGDYTNLSKAIEDGCKNPFTKIFVKKGTYDIIQEFKELYGETFFEDFSSSSKQGWVLSNKVHIIFEHGSKVICHYDGNNANVKTLFSPINAYVGGFTIEGIDLSCKNCRYCSHDDRWDASDAYDNNYINCKFRMDNTGNDAWTSRQCIGGGMGQCGSILIDGCVFENASPGNADVSWHNTPSEISDNKIVVRNCYFTGYLYITSFGESENKMQVFVSNNSLAQKVSIGMSPGATIVNVEVHEWNNYVRNS